MALHVYWISVEDKKTDPTNFLRDIWLRLTTGRQGSRERHWMGGLAYALT